MFDKMMIATDGSDNADAAVRYASEMAKKMGTREALVVHVCPGCSADIDVHDVNREVAEQILQDARHLFSGSGVHVRTLVEIDYPPESISTAIVDIAEREKVDLLVLGSRGLSEFKGLLLGSVGNRVVQKVSCPVLVIKHGTAEKSGSSTGKD